jgi:N utilization substance protein A
VSRADAVLVQKLFQMEVPEIYDGTVVIRAMAREAGERTKVAVFSKDPDVDCVGACVGMKGMRVQSIIRELRGEKIDIIEYSEDTVTFAANALSPAKINHVSVVDAEQKHLEVIVDDSQLSLAIGKKGQNVRLAAKLLGWRIDIKSEEEKRQEIESQMAVMALRGAPISELKGLGEKTMQRLLNHGVETVEQLAQMTPDELTQIQGIGEKTVEKIRQVVTDYFEADRQATEDAAAAEQAAAEAEASAAAQAVAEAPAEGAEQPPTGETPSAEAGASTEAPADSLSESASSAAEQAESVASTPEAAESEHAKSEDADSPHSEEDKSKPDEGGK